MKQIINKNKKRLVFPSLDMSIEPNEIKKVSNAICEILIRNNAIQEIVLKNNKGRKNIIKNK